MRRTLRWLGLMALLLGIIAVGFYGYQRLFTAPGQTSSARRAERVRDSNTVAVGKGDIVRTIAAFGEVFPKEEVVLRFKTGGIVQEIAAKEGERVAKGQVLARLSNAQQELKLLQAKNAYEAAKITASPNEVQTKELEYTIAQEEYEYTILKAPWDGEIIVVHVQEGDNITTGSSVTGSTDVVTLLNRDEMFITVDIDEVDIREIALGQRAQVTLDAYPDLRLSAEVILVDYRAVTKGSAKTVGVTLRLSKDDSRIKPGFSARAEIVVAEVQDALQVPLSAIRTVGGKSSVALVKGTEMEQAPVEVGLTTDEVAQIVSGLQEGDRILVVNSSVQDSQRQQQGNNRSQPFGFPGR